MIEGKTLKDQENPLRTIIEDRKAGIEKAARSFEQPPRMFGSRRSQDMSKYFHLHEDHGHDSNDCRQLRNQIEEAVKSGQLSHLVKGIIKERVKAFKNQRTEGKKYKSTTLVEAPILMIRQDESYVKNKVEGLTSEGKEITFRSGGSNSSAPVVIKAKIFGREVNRVHMDDESSCEEKNLVLLGNSFGNHDRRPPLTRKETLNFVIVKYDSPYNMLLGRTTMQKMGIMVSTIHGAIKFHTTEGIVVVNNKYPEQAVTIGKKLPEHFKERLQDFLRANADVFTWTHADMTGIPRTITVKGKPFNTKHKLNEYSHVKPIKQKRRGLGPNRSTTACKEVKELTKA
ncbi:hypothetical protein Tco_0696101 [Tanacetum coccineum]